ncbi:MAG: hypothetical protein F7B20_07985 [Aeropyrum sp.]|nr:hypothetical protein [Aeropyrum sp.]MCE4616442.1 hypothetical protein [Aeropyrum sp.]
MAQACRDGIPRDLVLERCLELCRRRLEPLMSGSEARCVEECLRHADRLLCSKR